jgi:hypothetical protein
MNEKQTEFRKLLGYFVGTSGWYHGKIDGPAMSPCHFNIYNEDVNSLQEAFASGITVCPMYEECTRGRKKSITPRVDCLIHRGISLAKAVLNGDSPEIGVPRSSGHRYLTSRDGKEFTRMNLDDFKTNNSELRRITKYILERAGYTKD